MGTQWQRASFSRAVDAWVASYPARQVSSRGRSKTSKDVYPASLWRPVPTPSSSTVPGRDGHRRAARFYG